MSDYHKLLIRTTTAEDKERARLDNLMGNAIVDRILQMEGKLPLGVAEIAGQQELTAEQREKLPYIVAMYSNCFVCDAEPPPFGMHTWQVGGQLIVTPICIDCSRLVGVTEIIKLKLQESQREGVT